MDVRKGGGTYQEFVNELASGRLRSLYILTGEEDFLIQQVKKKLLSVLLDERSLDMDLVKVDGSAKGKSELSLPWLRSHLRMPSFFSKRRVFLIRQSDWFCKPTIKEPELLELLLQLDETVCLLFLEEKVDLTQKKFWASVQEVGLLLKLDKQPPAQLQAWVKAYSQKLGFQLSPEAVDSLLARCDGQMTALSMELKKLQLYCSAKGLQRVDLALLDKFAPPDQSGQVFKLSELLIQKQYQEAYQLKEKLLAQQSSVLGMLVLIGRHLSQLLICQDFERQRAFAGAGSGFGSGLGSTAEADLAKQLAVSPYILQKLQKQARQLKAPHLQVLLETCFQFDWKIKQGKLEEGLALDLLMSLF